MAALARVRQALRESRRPVAARSNGSVVVNQLDRPLLRLGDALEGVPEASYETMLEPVGQSAAAFLQKSQAAYEMRLDAALTQICSDAETAGALAGARDVHTTIYRCRECDAVLAWPTLAAHVCLVSGDGELEKLALYDADGVVKVAVHQALTRLSDALMLRLQASTQKTTREIFGARVMWPLRKGLQGLSDGTPVSVRAVKITVQEVDLCVRWIDAIIDSLHAANRQSATIAIDSLSLDTAGAREVSEWPVWIETRSPLPVGDEDDGRFAATSWKSAVRAFYESKVERQDSTLGEKFLLPMQQTDAAAPVMIDSMALADYISTALQLRVQRRARLAGMTRDPAAWSDVHEVRKNRKAWRCRACRRVRDGKTWAQLEQHFRSEHGALWHVFDPDYEADFTYESSMQKSQHAAALRDARRELRNAQNKVAHLQQQAHALLDDD